MATDCLFCQIIAGDSPATIVHRTDTVTAIRDINPAAPTHILVLPNRHLASVAEAQPVDSALLGELMLTAAALARQAGLGSGYRLVVNTGDNLSHVKAVEPLLKALRPLLEFHVRSNTAA